MYLLLWAVSNSLEVDVTWALVIYLAIKSVYYLLCVSYSFRSWRCKTKKWRDQIHKQMFIVKCDRSYNKGNTVAVILILPSIQFKLGNTVTQRGGENFISETVVYRLLQFVIRSWTKKVTKERRQWIKEMFRKNDRTVSLINVNRYIESQAWITVFKLKRLGRIWYQEEEQRWRWTIAFSGQKD